jgi:hypothetical protein
LRQGLGWLRLLLILGCCSERLVRAVVLPLFFSDCWGYRVRIFFSAALCVAACLAVNAPLQAQSHVDYVPSQVPYSGDVQSFCLIGYPSHNWISVVPILGIWMPIIPWKPVNYQYINSFQTRCLSGGIIPSTL